MMVYNLCLMLHQTKMTKVLVIEDVPESAMLAKRLLDAQNYDVLLAANGGEGLEMVRKHNPDVILLDLGLPDIDADMLALKLCVEIDEAKTPVIVVSAWPEVEVRRMTESYCFKAYLTKPYNVDKFTETVRSYVN